MSESPAQPDPDAPAQLSYATTQLDVREPSSGWGIAAIAVAVIYLAFVLGTALHFSFTRGPGDDTSRIVAWLQLIIAPIGLLPALLSLLGQRASRTKRIADIAYGLSCSTPPIGGIAYAIAEFGQSRFDMGAFAPLVAAIIMVGIIYSALHLGLYVHAAMRR